jgi:UDP-3-O-[3-hydroxymyristoyl] glucosamine N-acyltransferase
LQDDHGVRLDNLVHIAHNVILGADTAIAAGVTIGGSAILGKRCQIFLNIHFHNFIYLFLDF